MRALQSLAATLLLLASCDQATDDTARDPCASRCDGNLGETILVQVPSDRLASPVAIELNPCLNTGYLPDGAPVVVVLSGSFKATITPVDRHELAVESRSGIVALYPSFPTDEGDFVSDHSGDYRGTGARWASETALQYATGDVEDSDGCTLADRIVSPLSDQPPWLHGKSNGGNLVMAVLADEQLDLPEIAGVTTFETPTAPQFVTVEVGSATQDLTPYEEGSCSWDPVEGLVCDMDYTQLSWDPDAVDHEGHVGVAFFDLDGSGYFDSDDDSPIWGIRPVVAGQTWLLYSARLNQALRDAGFAPDGLLSIEETLDFWATRDASRLVSQAVARHPELPFIVLGTENDHTLGIADHAHVSGLAHALQQSGARWVRVNPDLAFVQRALEAPLVWQDNPANLPTSPGDPAMSMLPDASKIHAHSRDYVTAALSEMMERRWCGAWSDDLDHVLLP